MAVSAIVPAYNEASRIGRVLEILTTCPAISEVIVVDDGSSDGTARVAERYSTRIVRNEINSGKGRALDVGVHHATHAVLFFCDADIVGLTHDIVTAILDPVLREECEMFVAARRSKVRRLGFGVTYSPLLDGQRALTRSLWRAVPARFKVGYEIETALNHVATRFPHGYKFAHFDITHVRKEGKRGSFWGRLERYRMYANIASATLLLTLKVE